MKPRQSRGRRHTGVRVRLTGRDEALLAALARFGVARSDHLREFLFPGNHRDVFADRARRLFDAGYLEVTVLGLNHPNLYSMGPRGRQWATAQGLTLVRPPRGQVEHWLGIVGTWVKLARLCHETPDWDLLQAQPEWELRPDERLAGSTLIPDLVAEMAVVGDRERPISIRLAVEVDLGTERASVLHRKVENYRNLLAFGEGLLGWVDFGVGFAVRGWSRARRESFARMLEEALPTWSLLWDLDDGPEAALRGLFAGTTPPVSTSRYGNGSSAAVSADVFADSPSQEEGL